MLKGSCQGSWRLGSEAEVPVMRIEPYAGGTGPCLLALPAWPGARSPSSAPAAQGRWTTGKSPTALSPGHTHGGRTVFGFQSFVFFTVL